MKKEMRPEGKPVLICTWGYAVIDDANDCLWIPAIWTDSMAEVLDELYKETGKTKMIFSAVLNPDSFRKHLRNIRREWKEWHEQAKDWSYCIEIEYEPTVSTCKV